MAAEAREKVKMGTGLHIVRKRRNGKPDMYYVYAWRGGPQIHASEGRKPKVTRLWDNVQ